TPTGSPWWSTPENQQLAQTRIKIYQCPGDNVYEVYSNPSGQIYITGFDYKTPPSMTYTYTSRFLSATSPQFGLTNYVGVSGKNGKYNTQFQGVLANQTTVKLDSITGGDGSSSTLMFGETLNSSYGSPRNAGLTWIGYGSFPTAYGIPAPKNVVYGDWSSNHPGGVNFVFCDGSAKTLRRTDATTLPIFQAASGYADGQSPDWNLLYD
ncbi:MAG: DUF1559 domain-containing protein, partial [Planctomycetes bacterium]|nr:DUF1559 domain-containing protein [Planctomycetota bacterium]